MDPPVLQRDPVPFYKHGFAVVGHLRRTTTKAIRIDLNLQHVYGLNSV
jgi:hypothetical protein